MVVGGDGDLNIDADGATVDAARGRLQELLENLFANAVEHGSTGPRSQAHEDAVEHGSTNPDSQARRDAAEHAADTPVSAVNDGVGDEETETAGDVTVRVGTLDDRDGFYVEDDGLGVPETDREDVFEMGYTTSDDGTGFGLAIIERVADTHDWGVSLTDGENGGARFEFVTE